MNPTANNAKGINTHSYPAYDYPVGIGTGLVAVKDGVISDLPGVPTRRLIGYLQNGNAWPAAGGGSPNSGNVINIDHGNGEFTSYLHASPFNVDVSRGRGVSKGQIFHKSGHNGWSTGPHLHFEVWKNGVRIDPGPWLENINQGDDMSRVGEVEFNNLFRAFIGDISKVTEADRKRWIGTETNTVIRAMEADPRHQVAILKPGKYIVN